MPYTECLCSTWALAVGATLAVQWRHRLRQRAWATCERTVWVDGASQELLLAALRWDKRDGDAHDRALARDMPSLRLVVSGRSEPSAALPDVGGLENLEWAHLYVCFWRTSTESLARHRNPLFCTELGLSPNRSLTVDALHCLYFGAMNVWCRTDSSCQVSSVRLVATKTCRLLSSSFIPNYRSGAELDAVTQQRSQ